MSSADFSSRREQLVQARAAAAAARAAHRQAAEEQKATAIEHAGLARSFNQDDEAAVAKRRRLDERARVSQAAAVAAGGEVRRAAEAAAAALEGFATFSDPRENAGRLSDSSPFALFPVRIETRFAAVGAGELTRPQLWVRIYPDECSIDTFEPTLSATELANAQRYWRGVWRAGRVEADERAAWRALATAHGSGRAGWIVDSYRPVNIAAQPTKAAASDQILVIPTQSPPGVGEAAAIVAYWQAVWLAGDSLTGQRAARDALEAAVGAARAGELLAGYQPYNLADAPAPPMGRTDVALSTAFLVFPPDPPTRQGVWSEAPRVEHFPERFVVLGYSGGQLTLEAIGGPIALPLYVGPDPSGDPSQSIHPEGGDLFVPDELKWMVDFDRAVAAGMGIAVDLTAEQARAGFDRLLVVGLQMSASEEDGKSALEALLRHHQVGRSGLSLVPQGTPTHNVAGTGTGYTRLDDADQSFDDRRRAPLFTPTDDPMQKRDGQWVAELLGIDPALFSSVHASGGTDQVRARAMQRALWPATLGYWMDKMLHPVFDDDTVENTRWFFTQFVSGRGAAPAIQIGGQPYGIMATTAFSRIRWLGRNGEGARGLLVGQELFLARLLALLRAVDADWARMSGGAARVGAPGDAHQVLLDVLGLHPTSVEYYSRYAESLTELYNIVNLWGVGPDFWQALLSLGLQAAGARLLAGLGYSGPQPDILNHVFLKDASLIANVIDDRPLSEKDGIRAYTDDGRNYVHWLIDAARTSLDALVAERGFKADASPAALLYLYLRHALMLAYYDTSYGLHRSAGFLAPAELAAMKPEPTFVHVTPGQMASESRFGVLYKTEARITNSPTVLVSDYITTNLATLAEARGLSELLDSLAVLADAPTAQLERAFAEHIDTCSYRFDAWLLGLVNFQLQAMRAQPRGEGSTARPGVYLGAYAWLEDLRPSPSRGTPVELPPDLEKVFAGPSAIVSDPSNGGYIHAPSMIHARTAAILRSGYLANATTSNPQTLSVNLSSDRVRRALAVLEGIRNGQSLPALLGYRFERGLHDDHDLAEVDKFIYPLRKAFPLVAEALSTTRTEPNVPIEAVEARNVLDGRKLIARIRSSGIGTYPYGLDTLPPATAAESAAIDRETEALLDVNDAIADLALAEGVHQAAQGNFGRVAATLDAYSTGNFPPEPEVVQTPPAGIGLTHRVAVHFRAGLGPPPNATPRSVAEPALDAWLAGILPPVDGVGCIVVWTDPIGGGVQQQGVTLADLGVRPIDLLSLVKPDDVQAMTELDDRILRFVHASAAPRPDAALQIQYMTSPAGTLSVFETAPLVRGLRTLVGGSRSLRATDAILHGEAAPEQDEHIFVNRARIAGPKAQLDTLTGDIGTYLGTLTPLLADSVANRGAIVSGIDGFLESAVELLERAARFNMPECGWGFVYAWRHAVFLDLIGMVRDLAARWDQKLHEFDVKIAAYDALPPGASTDHRFKLLRAAEVLVTTVLDPLPAAPATLRAALNVRRADFATRRQGFADVLATASTSLATTLADLDALLPVAQFDVQAIDLSSLGDRAITFAEGLTTILTGHRADIDSRRGAAQAQLDVHNALASAGGRAQALKAGAQALLGEEFHIVPEFTLSAAQADEWANAMAASTGGSLLGYLSDTLAMDFPVDEWLYSAARVRPMLHAWEASVMLASALGMPEPVLVPIQFPHQDGAPWLAMQFPPDYVLDGDRLLYTAQYVTPFDKTARQCGLLLDEWTEVIPSPNRTTGITFNFDRPESEPPQAVLLVTPATASGSWQWADIVGALNETLDLAKKRAVEPVQLDETAYSRFLPATIMAATLYGISITTSLAAANAFLSQVPLVQNA